MTRIRSLRHDDLPQVVALYRTHLAVPNLAGEEELRTAFEQVFLGEPLSAPDIPSLVIEGSGGGGSVIAAPTEMTAGSLASTVS